MIYKQLEKKYKVIFITTITTIIKLKIDHLYLYHKVKKLQV
jgi:hypothetical protein